jgi:hypothetical protein
MNKYIVRHILGTDEFEAYDMDYTDTDYTFDDEDGNTIHWYSKKNVICVSIVYAQED